MENPQKSPHLGSKTLYSCVYCDYNTTNSKDYKKHCFTTKHQNRISGNLKEINKTQDLLCSCGKEYQTYSGLWRHKKKCNTDTPVTKEITPDLVLKIIEQNKDLTNVILEQTKTINKLCDNSGNIITNNNTQINNKTFNLNMYLNETCKNAINMDEFVDNITLSLEDLEYTGRNGYIEGISNIILKNLKRLKEYDRPIHCSDNKREVLYIKSNNIWNKADDDKTILTNAIKVIANENIKQISKWREQNPDCTKSDSKKNDLYLKIVSNSMCGIDKEETNKNINKIVSNVLKEVTINKR